MRTPKYKLVSWYVVNTVIDLVCRSNEIWVEFVNFLCDEARINKPAKTESRETQNDYQYRGHKALSSGFLL